MVIQKLALMAVLRKLVIEFGLIDFNNKENCFSEISCERNGVGEISCRDIGV